MTPVIPWPEALSVKSSSWRPEDGGLVQRGLLSGSVRVFQGQERIRAVAKAPLKTAVQHAAYDAFLADLGYGANLALLWDWERHLTCPLKGVVMNDGSGALAIQALHTLVSPAVAGAARINVAGFSPHIRIAARTAVRIGGESYTTRREALADAGGMATLEVSPFVSVAASVGADVFCPASFGLFQLVEVKSGEIDGDGHGSFELSFVEVFAAERSEGLTLRDPYGATS
ncbi:MAG: hypothetical protein AAF092_05100 [Pseudomonadota bacterium]